MKRLPVYYFMTLCLSFNVACTQDNSKPNIIFILADDLGYGDVGFNGQDKIETPALDQMANEGIIFTYHYAGSTVCGPSRASLLTGFHTGHSQVRGNPKWTLSGKPVDLDATSITVAHELKRAGYTTGIVGKWGLAENLEAGKPNKQGFDYFYGMNKHLTGHHYYPEKLWENDSLFTVIGNNTKEKKGTYVLDLFTQKAKDFIQRNKEDPFFLYLAYTTPHQEWTAPEERKQKYYAKNWPLRKLKPGHYYHDENGHVTYATMVSEMDTDIGEINALLKELNIEKNTLVIFTSDNGHQYDDTKNEFFNSNGDFKGIKRDLYEGGIRMPFVAKWPEKINPNTVSKHRSAFWDFLPTACEIANITPQKKVDGISYMPALLGAAKQKQHDYMYWEFNEKKGPLQALTRWPWKLHYIQQEERYELYHLEQDVSESENIYEDYPKVASELKILMSTARTEHPEFPLTKRN